MGISFLYLYRYFCVLEPTIKGLHMMSLPVSNTSCRHDRRSTTIRTVCFVKKLRIF